MKVVIDISEERYRDIQRIAEVQLDMGRFQTGEQIIANGTPLPKGHGRLIDAKDLRLDIIAHKYTNNFCEEHNIDQSINLGMLNILIADAPTIIEAYRESEEKE